MGIISNEKINHLYWMGRYVERAYTSIKEFIKCSDSMIDDNELEYVNLCEKLGILNTYKDKTDFRIKFPYDETNNSSIISCLVKAMDNAIILREMIGSETLSYLQIALDAMKIEALKNEEASFLKLQYVLDIILAFWGSVEDAIYDEGTRNVIKAGKRLERLDLMLRMESYSNDEIIYAMKRLRFRLEKSPINYNKDIYLTLEDIILNKKFDKKNLILLVEELVEC